VRVIILAAGQGKRLLPLTAEKPKALLDIGGKSLIERQVEAFAACGLKQFSVVTGYGSDLMEDELKRIARLHKVSVEPIFNPFFALADNLASCWMARAAMTGDFIQVNGDNVFRADVVQRLLAAPEAPACVAVNTKPAYDADDMKVMLKDGLVVDIGKTLDVSRVGAEAIGFYMFRGAGPQAYVNALERAVRDPHGLKQWFPAAVASLAREMDVATVSITGLKWGEVDFPHDLDDARQLVASWG
jgi:choline kinase